MQDLPDDHRTAKLNLDARAWIKWDHPTTLPNPSLETLDDVELVEADTRLKTL